MEMQEVLKAAKLINEYCDSHDTCHSCIFWDPTPFMCEMKGCCRWKKTPYVIKVKEVVRLELEREGRNNG